MKGIVTSEWLALQLSNKISNIKILDASWYLPFMNRNAFEEYKTKRIQTARFFDLDNDFSDLQSSYSHMLPSKELFWNNVSKLGIKKDDFIVTYDGMGIFSSARCWWMFRVMGWNENRIAVLNGGFPNFSKEYPQYIETNEINNEDINIKQNEYNHYKFNNNILRSINDIEDNLNTKKEIIIDARPYERFIGKAPEPRPIPSGHMPNSISIPFTNVLDNGYLRSKEELKEIFKNKGLDINNGKDIISSCGSGVSAAILDLALTEAECKVNHSLYDGSWSEYADQSITKRPIIINNE